MKLLLLGTTGYHPNGRRHTACLMLPELGIVLDAGTAFFRVREHLATDELDIFLTHSHLDHVVGLTFLYDVLYEKSMRGVTVHAAHEKIDAIDRLLLDEALFPVKLPCQFEPLDAPVALRGDGRLTYFPLEHPGGSLGFRLDWPGHSMAYVTDTMATEDAPYIDAIRDVDLLIHECYFPDGYEQVAEQTGHSCITPVAQVARAAGAGRLILVHLNPLDESDDPVGVETARAIFPKTELGNDLMEVEF